MVLFLLQSQVDSGGEKFFAPAMFSPEPVKHVLQACSRCPLVVAHLLFILFVVAGGLLLVQWRWIAWLHLPAVIWGILIEWRGWVCPLRPLENRMRELVGQAGYRKGFIEHYLLPAIYPAGLTTGMQVMLGGIVIVVNAAGYGYLLSRTRR